MQQTARRAIVLTVLVSLVVYTAVAALRHWWPSVIAATIVAALLWVRHPRARFATYIFFTVLAARGLLGGLWALPLYALTVVGLMQTRSAQHEWPRLVAGWRRDRGDRMRRS